MPHSLKILAASVATFIAITAYIPYLIDMFRGKNKPHLYTWISYFLVTITVAVIQVMGGAGLGAIPTILSAIVNAVILFFCFRFGTKDITPLDKICLGLSVAGITAFIVLHNRPLLALAIVTAAEITSFIPTFRKTYNDPYSESLPSYFLSLVKLVLILIALDTYNLLTASYSVLWIIVFLAFLAMVYQRRTQVKKHKTRPASPDIAHV